MNLLLNWFSEAWIERLGWVLLHFLWQGSVVALLLAVGLNLLTKTSSHIRYLMAGLALLICAITPIFTWILLAPKDGTPVPTNELSPGTSEVIQDHSLPPIIASNVIWEASPGQDTQQGFKLAKAVNLVLPLAVGLWFTGVMILSIRLSLGWFWMNRLCRSSIPVQDLHCLKKFESLLSRMQIIQSVQLLESVLIEVPTLIGWFRPVILIPASLFAGMTPDQLEAILAHELAHVRRCDYLVNLFQTMIETILFYHPAIWWISSKLREERENCCDDIALEVMADRLIYVSALSQLEEARALPLTLTASGGSLVQRIRRIVCISDRKTSTWPLAVLIIGGFIAVGWGTLKTVVKPESHEVVKAKDDSVLPGFVRTSLKVIQISEADYQAHKKEIDDAVQRGDDTTVSSIKSYKLISEPSIVIKSGDTAVLDAAHTFSIPMNLVKDAAGNIVSTNFQKRSLGMRLPVTVTLTGDKIHLKARLEETTFQGYVQNDQKVKEAYFNTREAYYMEELSSGQTKGIDAGGSQVTNMDLASAPDSQKNPTHLARRFIFLTAKSGGEAKTVAKTVEPVKEDIQIETKLVEIKDTTYVASQEKIDSIVDSGDLKAFVGMANQMEGVSLLCTPNLTADVDQKGLIKIVREMPYPSNFSSPRVFHFSATGHTKSTAVVAPTPRDFETKDVGVSVQITPSLVSVDDSPEGDIMLDGNLTVTDFQGFTKSNLVGGTPTFSTIESHFVEAVEDGKSKIICIPGAHYVQDPPLDMYSEGKTTKSADMVKARFFLCFTARVVSPDGR